MNRIEGTTRIVGLMGYPIGHTLSPAMHNAAFRRLGLDFTYIPMPVKPGDIERAVQSIKPLDILGVNVTAPYKEEVLKYVDGLRGDAKLIGAVNTIHNSGGKLIGYNTDAEGFIISLKSEGRINPRGKNVLLVGAGGVGRAIGVKLAGVGVSTILIADIDSKKSNALKNHIRKCFGKVSSGTEARVVSTQEIKKVMKNIDILINATTVGMHKKDPCLVNPEWFHGKLFVYDVVYNIETKLLKEARKKGLKALGGLGMLVHQGALAFAIWTGKKPPVKVMREAIIRKVSG